MLGKKLKLETNFKKYKLWKRVIKLNLYIIIRNRQT